MTYSTCNVMVMFWTGLTRENQEALDEFIVNDGFSVVMRAMQTDVEKLKIKSAFLLSSICTDNNKCKGETYTVA